jgi:hypothetical protein
VLRLPLLPGLCCVVCIVEESGGVCSYRPRAIKLAATHRNRRHLTEYVFRPPAAGSAAVQVAVSSDLMHPHNRLIVDDYELTQDGNYRLRSVGTGGWVIAL